jgi:hypothetical protein
MMFFSCKFMLAAIFLVVALTVSKPANAQDAAAGDKPAAAAAPAKPAGASGGQSQASGKGKKTTVNFEDELVEGQTQKPELFYLLQQRNNNFKRLIKLRENFLPEMRKTSEEVQRTDGNGKGSGN